MLLILSVIIFIAAGMVVAAMIAGTNEPKAQNKCACGKCHHREDTKTTVKVSLPKSMSRKIYIPSPKVGGTR